MAPTKQKELEKILDFSIRPQGTQPHPWLLMLDEKREKREKQVFYSITEGRYCKKNIPEMCDKAIFTYNKEWLVTVDYDSGACCLLNIVSMEKIELPEYDRCRLWSMCCYLTSPPGDPNCRVVFLDTAHPRDLSVCQPGDDNFVKKEFLISKEDRFLMCTTVFKGSIYGLGYPTLSLVRANLNDLIIEFQTVFRGGPMQNILLDDCPLCYLIESCSELLLVMRCYLRRDICDFQVFRADFSRLEWQQLTSIGERAIFLDANSLHGYCCSASGSGIQENCIYYTEFGNRLLYIFNLENGTFTSTMACPTINRKNLVHHWVMIPPTSLSNCCNSES